VTALKVRTLERPEWDMSKVQCVRGGKMGHYQSFCKLKKKSSKAVPAERFVTTMARGFSASEGAATKTAGRGDDGGKGVDWVHELGASQHSFNDAAMARAADASQGHNDGLVSCEVARHLLDGDDGSRGQH
jgi:hypothetical protein